MSLCALPGSAYKKRDYVHFIRAHPATQRWALKRRRRGAAAGPGGTGPPPTPGWTWAWCSPLGAAHSSSVKWAQYLPHTMRWNDIKCPAHGRPSTKVDTQYILCERNAITYIKDRGFPGGLVVKNSPAKAGERMFAPWVRRSPGEGNGSQLQYSCLGNPMHRRAWRATVHGVTKESNVT